MRFWRHVASAMLCLSTAAGVGAARAQTQTQPVISSPQAIAECLCLHQQVEWRSVELAVARKQYEQAQQDLEILQQETQRRRPLVQTEDPQSVEAFRRLQQRADEARVRYNGEVVPNYNRMIGVYSDIANLYSARCGGRAYDTAVLQSVRQGLTCPPVR